jgi:hypothetical protein
VQPGQTQPAYRIPAQFMVPNYIWTNATVGSHVLSIHAYGFHGVSINPPSWQVNVLPPLPRPPVQGTHVVTGKEHYPFKPEQVRLAKTFPNATYEVVGSVAALVPGDEPQDVQTALAELKRQAALMGANWIILDPIYHTDETLFSLKPSKFSLPQTRASGKALYAPSSLWHE